MLKRSASLLSLAYKEVVGVSTLPIAEEFWSGVSIADQGPPPIPISTCLPEHIQSDTPPPPPPPKEKTNVFVQFFFKA